MSAACAKKYPVKRDCLTQAECDSDCNTSLAGLIVGGRCNTDTGGCHYGTAQGIGNLAAGALITFIVLQTLWSGDSMRMKRARADLSRPTPYGSGAAPPLNFPPPL